MFEPIHGSAFDITGLGIGERYRLEFHDYPLILLVDSALECRQI